MHAISDGKPTETAVDLWTGAIQTTDYMTCNITNAKVVCAVSGNSSGGAGGLKVEGNHRGAGEPGGKRA